ncbi:hypothetical protein [Calidifontibacter terrae]
MWDQRHHGGHLQPGRLYDVDVDDEYDISDFAEHDPVQQFVLVLNRNADCYDVECDSRIANRFNDQFDDEFHGHRHLVGHDRTPHATAYGGRNRGARLDDHARKHELVLHDAARR